MYVQYNAVRTWRVILGVISDKSSHSDERATFIRSHQSRCPKRPASHNRTFYRGECTHGASISCNKLSNLLKSVCLCRWSPFARAGSADSHTSPENVVPFDPLITRTSNESCMLARYRKSSKLARQICRFTIGF